MTEGRGVFSLEVGEFLQETRNLEDDLEDRVRGWMVVHLEALDGLVVLDGGVVALFLQLLPEATEVVLVLRVVKQKEVLNAGDGLLQLEVLSTDKQMICQFIQFADGGRGFLQCLRDSFMSFFYFH